MESAEEMIESTEEAMESAEEMTESTEEAMESAEEESGSVEGAGGGSMEISGSAEEEGGSMEASLPGPAEIESRSEARIGVSAERASRSEVRMPGSAGRRSRSTRSVSISARILPSIPSEYLCSICNNITLNSSMYPIGLLCRVTVNYAIERSLSADYSLSPNDYSSLMDMNGKAGICVTEMMKQKFEFALWRYLTVVSPKYANLVYVPSGIDVKTCGHYAHFKCFRNYIGPLYRDPYSLTIPLLWSVKLPCPACYEIAHCLLPIIPKRRFQRKRLHMLNDDTSKVLLTTTIDNLICSGADQISEETDEECGSTIYGDLFSNFIAVCHKWTDNWRDRHCDDGMRIQPSVIGIVKGKCERNILSSELNFSQLPNAELPTKFVIYGGRYYSDAIDLEFAKYEWKELTFGFDPTASDESIQSDSNFMESLESNLITEASRTEQENMNMPMVLFDLKTTLIRLSIYIITSDCSVINEKRVMLRFIYQMILAAVMIRTAILSVIRMPLPQALSVLNLTSSDNIFIYVMKNVAKRIISKNWIPPVDVIRILSRNLVEFDYEEAMRYACTDLSRLTAQLWHECDILVYNNGYHIGHETFMNIYKQLTGQNDFHFSPQLIPEVRIDKWTKEVMQWINDEYFHMRLCMEPLIWRRFTLIKPSQNYCEIFLLSCFQQCRLCARKSTHQYLCLLCGRLLNLDRICYDISKCLSFHANECGNSAACFLSISNRLILIVLGQLGAFWGHLYLDANGHEVDDLTSSVPLYLSEEQFRKLIEDWILQSFQIVFRDLTELIVD